VKRTVIPAAIVLLVVFAYAIANGFNRSGPVPQSIVLTERELTLPYDDPGDDDQGFQLRFEFEHRSDPLDARNWLTEDRLRAIGFPLHLPAGSPDAAHTYSRAIPRIAWVVFEFGGEAWRAVDARRALQPSPVSAWRGIEPTRLVPVDAGPDVETLRSRYGAGHLILRATIGLTYVPPSNRGPLVYGWIRTLHPSAVTVPRSLRPLLEGLPRTVQSFTGKPDETLAAPRFEVELSVGRLGIPYVTGVRRTR
jgi:hypothetical protein